jgi:8-oxo-dGTP pyrophosphatase MutT (NUDIX family)
MLYGDKKMPQYRTTSVRAVIRKDDKVLVEWFAPKSISFLPGGAIEEFEELKSALIRELDEELDGPNPIIRRYLGKIGHRWSTSNGIDSCLNHFFEVELGCEDEVMAKEAGRQLRWLELDSPEFATLQPPILRRLILQPVSTEWNYLDSDVDGDV